MTIVVFGFRSAGTQAAAIARVVSSHGALDVAEFNQLPVVPRELQGPGFTALVELPGPGWSAFAGFVDEKATEVRLLNIEGRPIDTAAPTSGAVVVVGAEPAQIQVFSGIRLIAARSASTSDERGENLTAPSSRTARIAASRFINANLRGDVSEAEDQVAGWISAHRLVVPLMNLVSREAKVVGDGPAPGGRTFTISYPGGDVADLTVLIADQERTPAVVYYYEYRLRTG
jgi:hypothetical protein